MSFLPTFDQQWAPNLRHRASTFRMALQLLEEQPGPHVICETGCMRCDPGEEAAKNDETGDEPVGDAVEGDAAAPQ